MSSLLLLPTNTDSSLTIANIYRSNVGEGIFSVIDTVASTIIEYVDDDGDVSKFYKISFTDGVTESNLIAVIPFEKQVVNVIRNLIQISSDDLSDITIVNLIPPAQHDIRIDICEYVYGADLTYIDDGLYSLPNRYFFDLNNGGAISTLDLNFYLQTIPVYAYSEKTPIVPIVIDIDERYIQLDRTLLTTEQIKINYYMTRRRIETDTLLTMLAYKIAANHFDEQSLNASSTSNKVKVGDIAVNSSTSSNALLQDTYYKLEAKYNKLITNFKRGFYRAKI